MKYILTLPLLFCIAGSNAQDSIAYTGKTFFAVSAANADSVAGWYQDIFGLKLQKEIHLVENGIEVRILSNDHLQVEILQHKLAKPFKEAGVQDNQQSMLHHLFKTGFYVANLDAVTRYLKTKGVPIKNGPFEDRETRSRSIIIEGPEGILLQLMEQAAIN